MSREVLREALAEAEAGAWSALAGASRAAPMKVRRRLRDFLDRFRWPGYRCLNCDGWFMYAHQCGDRNHRVPRGGYPSTALPPPNPYLRQATPPGEST